MSAIILICLTSMAAGPLSLGPDVNWAFSQAFWYGIMAAVLYFICASLMVVTVWGAYKGKYEKDFKLTTSQRTLMLQTISFLIYLLLGALVYSHIEGWSYLDAVYWADFTLLTIGIGDLAPITGLGRGLLFPFAIGGIIILGLVIGSIRSLVLERGKVKLGARMMEKERRRVLKELSKTSQELLVPIKDQSEEEKKQMSERKRRQKEFEIMRRVQDRAQTQRRWTALFVSSMTWFALWFVGAVIFQITEYGGQQWDYFQGVYFAYTSLLTIGYGDISPISNAGRAFFVFWSLLAVPSLTILISNMGDTIVKVIRDATLSVGGFTLLPAEKGFRATFRQTVNGAASKLLKKESPPGILGDLNNRTAAKNDDSKGQRKNDPEGPGQRAAGDQAQQEEARAKEDAKTDDERAMPKSRKSYHYMLIREMASVMKHLNSSPPRKYTFDEWAWYLKLVGEEEDDARTHRRAVRKPRKSSDGKGGKGYAGVGSSTGQRMDEDREVKWSWIGNRSPLMGGKEEAEWVLERLTRRLERELEAVKREEESGEAKKSKLDEEWERVWLKKGEGKSDGEEEGDENDNGNGRSRQASSTVETREKDSGSEEQNRKHGA